MIKPLKNATTSDILASIPDLLFDLDLEGRYHAYHSAQMDAMDVPPESFLGKLVNEVMPSHAASIIMAALAEANEKGFSRGQQIHLDFPGGHGWFELSIAKQENPDNSIPHFIVLSRDITKHKINEKLLLEQTELLNRTNELGNIGGWNVDLETMKLTWTRQTFRIAEVDPPVEPTFEEGLNLFAPEVRHTIAAAVQAAKDKGIPYDLELPIITAKGNHRWVQTQGVAEMQEGKSVRICGTFQDITARKASKKALIEQAELLELTGRMAKVGGWELDLSTMRVTWSKETARLHEVDENYEAPLLDTGENWYPPEAWPAVKEAVVAAIQHGTPYDMESPFITAKGRRIWVRIQGFPVIVEGKTIKLRGFFQDITDRKLASQALSLSEQRLTLALEGAGDGVWDWDILTSHVYYSPQWEKMFGFEPGTVAQNLETMTPRLHPDDAAGLFAEVGRYLSHEISTYSHECRMFHKSGKILHTLHRGKAQFDPEGKAIRMFGTCIDITDRKQIALDLEKAVQASNSAALSKSEFLTSMSHEIRTPMNGVLGLTQLLEETPLDPEQKDLVQTIKSSGTLLLTLLNDILDFSRIEIGKLEIEVLPISIRGILSEIQKSLSVSSRAKGITFDLNIANDVPELLLSDPSRIRQIIFNLVGNAIKFTAKGGVKIDVNWKNKSLSVDVLDTGLGISPDKQELIFQRFSQADSSTARKYGGSGLGLAISKRLVELMGGEIGLISEIGRGSTFWFTIPMTEPGQLQLDKFQESANPTSAPTTEVTPFNFSQLRILLVEDNLVNQKVAGGMLKKLACTFDLAQNGLEAVTLSMQNDYSLILMDCEMPEMDGYAATREIRRREALEMDVHGKPKIHRRIVALTANAMSDDEMRCLACGMDGFLPKPIQKEELQRVIANLIPH